MTGGTAKGPEYDPAGKELIEFDPAGWLTFLGEPRPSDRVSLIDVSAGAALVETSHRLLPCTVVELHVERDNEPLQVRGRVLRSAVVRVRPTWVCYRGAIGFERHLPWLLDEGVCPTRPGDARSVLPERAAATPEVM